MSSIFGDFQDLKAAYGAFGIQFRKTVWRALAIGVPWFFVEASFIVVLNLFLVSLGLLSATQIKFLNIQFEPIRFDYAVLILILYGLARALVLFGRYYFSATASQTFIRENREELGKLAITRGNLVSTPELVDSFTSRIQQGGYAVNYAFQGFSLVVSSFALLILGLYLMPGEFLFSLILLGLGLLPFQKLSFIVTRSGNGIIEQSTQIADKLLAALRNFYFLKIFRLQSWAIGDLNDSLAKYEKHYRAFAATQAFRGTYPTFLGILILAFVALLGRRMLNTDGETLIAYVYLFFRFAQGLGDAHGIYNEFKLQVPGLKSVARQKSELVNVKVDESSNGKEEKRISSVETYSVQNLGHWFSERKLFSNLSFELRKGDLLEIRGPSGTGKSTLLSLCLGMYLPREGQILINDLPIEEVRESLVPFLGYVGPDTFLINGTIRENLKFGLSEKTEFDESYALELIDRLQIFPDLENPLEAVVGDYVTLSSGQKQRLSMVRCLLRRPQLIFLDEATANLDAENEARVAELIKEVRTQSIVVSVSHKVGALGEPTQILDLGVEESKRLSIVHS